MTDNNKSLTDTQQQALKLGQQEKSDLGKEFYEFIAEDPELAEAYMQGYNEARAEN